MNDLPRSIFVDGFRYELFVRGNTIKVYSSAFDVWHKATVSGGKLTPTTPDFPAALQARIEERYV
jgi:hypothetical protein